MEWSWLLRNLLASLLLPPMCFLLPLLLGLLLLWRQRIRYAVWCLTSTMIGIYLASTPLVAAWSRIPLEAGMRFNGADGAAAIVVLGGGRRTNSEYDGQIALAEGSSLRLKYAAWLAKRLNLPLLVTGGAPDGGGFAEAEVMQQELHDFYGLSARWVEGRSSTTAENARFSAPLLKAAGIHRVILVSHAWHLPRAIPEFEREGLSIVPAGVDFSSYRQPWIRNLIPSAHSLEDTSWAVHERLGMLWYQLKF